MRERLPEIRARLEKSYWMYDSEETMLEDIRYLLERLERERESLGEAVRLWDEVLDGQGNSTNMRDAADILRALVAAAE